MLATDDEQTLNNETPPTIDRGRFVQMLLVVVMTVTVVVGLLGWLVDDCRLGGAGYTNPTETGIVTDLYTDSFSPAARSTWT